tara:strand:- start:1932 stop:2930 length:999 start_codon:yes stop_codon:yes gene_type:complete
MKWLITGGCGFIGCALTEKLIQDGHSVRILDNNIVGTTDDIIKKINPDLLCNFTNKYPIPDMKCGKVQFIQGDILDCFVLNKVIVDIDVVVHLAANTGVGPSVDDPKSDFDTNVIGTFNVLNACRNYGKISRFIFASSGAPVGEVNPPIHEELAAKPVSPYGASKLAGEGYCSAFYRTYGLETVALRFGNVYGPGSDNKDSVVAKFIKSILLDETFTIYGDGHQTRDYIYIDDLIEAIGLSASQKSAKGEVFQIATNNETSLNELVEKLRKVFFQLNATKIKCQHSPSRLGDVRRNYSDTRKAEELLNWYVKTDLNVGLHKTVEYFVSEFPK